jgi:hypothetical protein
MYTNMSITDASAMKIITALYANQKPRSMQTLTLEIEGRPTTTRKTSNGYVLEFGSYLVAMPQLLIALEIEPTVVELVRPNNAPTKAHAGYYRDEETGCSATVERVLFVSDEGRQSRNYFIHNIRVSGPSLTAVQEYNSKLSSGALNDQRVHAFE